MLFDVGYEDSFFLFCCLMLICRFFVLFDVGYGDSFLLFDVGMQILCAV